MAKFSDEIFADNTPLQRRMTLYEDHDIGDPPDLDPMRINWKVFYGKWNEDLCDQFVQYCVQKGLGEGNPNEDELQQVVNIFWERVGRIRTWINQNRLTENETNAENEARSAGRHRDMLVVARRNTRRQQVGCDRQLFDLLLKILQIYQSRIDTCLDHLPGEGQPADEATDAWNQHFEITEILGVEGQSSDETDEENPNVYNVRILPWRNKEFVQKNSLTDQARNTTNAYGNPRAGNRPRTRKRRRDAKVSERKAPRGKPINYYDQEWYYKLTPGQRRALEAGPEKPFGSTGWNDEY
jgi:hypothetical protein